MAIGFKALITYTPDNGMVTYDPESSVWVSAIDAWIPVGWVDPVFTLGPDTPPTTARIDYVNTSDSTEAAIRVVLLFNSGVQTPFDLVAFQIALEINAALPTAEATLASFDSGSSMSYKSVFVEQWSDEETL